MKLTKLDPAPSKGLNSNLTQDCQPCDNPVVSGLIDVLDNLEADTEVYGSSPYTKSSICIIHNLLDTDSADTGCCE